MEENFKPVVLPRRRLNPNMKEVVKAEVIKLLDLWAHLSNLRQEWWVSPVQVMLERLSGHLYYCFLDGMSGYFQIPIAPEDQEKTTFTCPYGTFAYRRMPFVFGDSFDLCLANLKKVLVRCEETNLVLNWEKCHFMVQEGIVLGHKISCRGIEVDKAKVDTISKLPPPASVKAIRSFLGHAGFYRRFIKDFSKIARPLTRLLEKDAVFDINDECLQAFNTLKEKLTTSPIMVAPDWSQPIRTHV
ncbi:hypothetical protein DH2020_012426 [Rehmannia glutinosa]|uniref:Retrovirus-related Pol polyprotein from transposon 17.6 n=1 Tax=Rehmannia glutinosa TaxID=99300 RepID=A0ABR0X2F0_REHGL